MATAVCLQAVLFQVSFSSFAFVSWVMSQSRPGQDGRACRLAPFMQLDAGNVRGAREERSIRFASECYGENATERKCGLKRAKVEMILKTPFMNSSRTK